MGVHGAVAVAQPREDVKEPQGDAATHGLEGRGTSWPRRALHLAWMRQTANTRSQWLPAPSLPSSGGAGSAVVDSGPPQQGGTTHPQRWHTWTMLATKKGSQVTKNMPSRMPRVRLAFKAFLLCLLARRWLSADLHPGRVGSWAPAERKAT